MQEQSKSLVVMGIDLSPTGTSLVTVTVDLAARPPKGWEEAPLKPSSILLLNRGKADGRADDAKLRGMSIHNLAYVASAIGGEIQKQKPDLALIEDYSGGGTQNAFILACTGEVTGACKLHLFAQGVPWFEVSGNTLKKFVSGKGAGKKEVMWLGCFKRWGIDNDALGFDNNTLDGYCLARFGLAMTLSTSKLYDPTNVEKECFKAVRPGGSGRQLGKKRRQAYAASIQS